jgi:hypothetical protein
MPLPLKLCGFSTFGMIVRRLLLFGDIEDATTIAALEEVVLVASVIRFGCNDWILRNS